MRHMLLQMQGFANDVPAQLSHALPIGLLAGGGLVVGGAFCWYGLAWGPRKLRLW